jgi:hypothetical protein
MFLYCQGDVPLLFTENETNNERIFGEPNEGPYVKDGTNNYIVSQKEDAINPQQKGTKVAAHYELTVAGKQTATIWMRMSKLPPAAMGEPFRSHFVDILQARRDDADEFYRTITPGGISEDETRVVHQALAGMLWTKQYLVSTWKGGFGSTAQTPSGRLERSCETASGSTC